MLFNDFWKHESRQGSNSVIKSKYNYFINSKKDFSDSSNRTIEKATEFEKVLGYFPRLEIAENWVNEIEEYNDCPERILVINHRSGHRPPDYALEAGYLFMDKWLKNI